MNDHGKCYTFKPERSDDDPVPGEVHGYQFIFHIKDGDQTSLPGGWNVYIHDPNEWWAGKYVQDQDRGRAVK